MQREEGRWGNETVTPLMNNMKRTQTKENCNETDELATMIDKGQPSHVVFCSEMPFSLFQC